MKLKSSYNFKLFSKETPKNFCLRTSLGIVNVKIYINLNKVFLTVKVGKVKVWSGNFEMKRDDLIDFTKKNLEIENSEDSKKFESVDQIIRHYTHEMAEKMSESEDDKGDDENEEKKEEEIDWEKLEEKLEKYVSQ